MGTRLGGRRTCERAETGPEDSDSCSSVRPHNNPKATKSVPSHFYIKGAVKVTTWEEDTEENLQGHGTQPPLPWIKIYKCNMQYFGK